MSDKQQQIESLNSEIQILQKKLDSKTKAFAILINELDTLKYERDQFKSLADSLQEKCGQIKKQATNKIDSLSTIHLPQTVYEHPNDTKYSSLKEQESTIHLLKTALKTVQDEKEVLQTKIDELTCELNDAKGDLSIFRQKRYRARNNNHQNGNDDNELNEDQTILLKHLEQSNERIIQLDNDLKLILCQKEELEIERDSFKTKYNKLNHELNKMLNGNEKHIVDIELILSENRYLKEKLNELKQEKNLAVANATKYKDLLKTHRLGKVQSSGSILTHQQVRSLINQSYVVPNTPEMENDLRSIAEALFENMKDKNLTIIHQRKINKILANRVTELEQLLSQCKLNSKSEQTSSLINLLDRTPSPSIPDSSTSQFVNSPDKLQPLSPTQIFNFPPIWSRLPLSSTRILEDDYSNKNKELKHTATSMISTLECHQSTKLRSKSESTDLEMDDPLQSPTLTSSIAYLEATDLIPDSDLQQPTKTDIEHLHDLLNTALDKNHSRQTSKLTNPNSTSAANLTC